MDKKQYLDRELDLLLGWIRAADSRIALTLPLAFAMLGVIASLGKNVHAWTVLMAVITAFTVVPLALLIMCSAITCFPRTTGPKGSMVFFTGINDRSLSQYEDSVKAMSDEDLVKDLISQCHINAQIAQTKFIWVKKSLLWLFIATSPWFLSIYLLYKAA